MPSLLLAPLLLAAVLVLSGVMKLKSPEESASAFTSLKLPKWVNQPFFHRALPIGELVLAVLLLILPSPLSIVVAALTLVLMLIYVVVIARALTFGYPVDCSCFGELGLGEVKAGTLVRNILLSLAGVAAVVFAAYQDASPLGFLSSADLNTWGWIIGAIITATLAVLILTGASSRPKTRLVPPAGAPVEEAVLDEGIEEEAEYLRVPTPAATVLMADGRQFSIRDLARRQALLLVFVSPTCGSCRTVIEQLDELRAKVEPIALHEVLMMEPEQGNKLVEAGELHSIEHALFDPSRMLTTAIEVGGTPSAVLLGTDDLLAGGPVAGSHKVLEFIEDVAAQLQESMAEMPTEDEGQPNDER